MKLYRKGGQRDPRRCRLQYNPRPFRNDYPCSATSVPRSCVTIRPSLTRHFGHACVNTGGEGVAGGGGGGGVGWVEMFVPDQREETKATFSPLLRKRRGRVPITPLHEQSAVLCVI